MSWKKEMVCVFSSIAFLLTTLAVIILQLGFSLVLNGVSLFTKSVLLQNNQVDMKA